MRIAMSFCSTAGKRHAAYAHSMAFPAEKCALIVFLRIFVLVPGLKWADAPGFYIFSFCFSKYWSIYAFSIAFQTKNEHKLLFCAFWCSLRGQSEQTLQVFTFLTLVFPDTGEYARFPSLFRQKMSINHFFAHFGSRFVAKVSRRSGFLHI
jgi:hypothetical protein